MKRVFALAVLAMLGASRAQAAPITVSAGDFVTFNFDLTAEIPPPPYVVAFMSTNVSDLDFAPPPCNGLCDLLDVGVWNFWTELDGLGTLFFTYPVNLGSRFDTEMKDGVFSATLSMTAGSITVDPVACGIAPDGTRTPDCPPAPPPPAPEPATLSLLTSAAAAAMLGRRSRLYARAGRLCSWPSCRVKSGGRADASAVGVGDRFAEHGLSRAAVLRQRAVRRVGSSAGMHSER
jgi:hypothetical protein